jgi:hypothetical protein
MTTVHISFIYVAQLLSIAPTTTTRLNAKLHSIACSCCCWPAGGVISPRVPAGSALSRTSRVCRARIAKCGRAATVLVACQQPRYDLEMTVSSHCQYHCQCPAHYTSHYATASSHCQYHCQCPAHCTSDYYTSRAVRSEWVKGHVPFCAKCCIQYTVDTSVVT